MSSTLPENPAVAGTAGAYLTSFDPATGEAVGRVPVTPASEIPLAVHRARQAQRSWAGMTLEERVALLRPAAERIRERTDRIAELISREMGKPIGDAKGEATYAATGFSELLDEALEALKPETRSDEATISTLVYDPLGVCAAITPWNFPVLMPQECVVPALVAGNTVILKPSEESPLCAWEWAKCLMEILPADVLQVIFGDEVQGKALVASEVNMIAFTGSRAAGKHILEAAGRGLKRVILELGGKDPLIVLKDADLETASAFAARNSFRNAGQVCVSTERIYVHRSIADAFEAKVAEKAKALKQGPGREEGVTIGPMVNARQKSHVLRQIDTALGEGAKAIAGNEPRPGNFVAPTVLVNVTNDMTIMREETFGPVACIVRYDEVDQAIRWANESPYALGGAVFGADVANAEQVARRLHSGMVGINRGCGGAKGTPWVGAKQSGYGYHSGRDGHRQFAQVRVISRAK
jgi:acyl-CoA reductase-like NAD-dependent aldehyde dehydrogenase